VFAGFAQTPARAQDKKLVIAFIQTGSESGWRTSFTDAMKAEATKEGIDLKFTDGQQKQEVQMRASVLPSRKKFDAILLAPIVETGWDAVLKEAQAAKIPLIEVDRDVKVSDPALYPVTRVAATSPTKVLWPPHSWRRLPRIIRNTRLSAISWNSRAPLAPVLPLTARPASPTR